MPGSSLACCSARKLDADRHGKVLISVDSEGSNEDAQQHSGFGVRVYPTGSKVFVVQTRAGGKAARRVTVGRHGVVTPEEVRRRAALIVARIKAGEEPAAEPLAARDRRTWCKSVALYAAPGG